MLDHRWHMEPPAEPATQLAGLLRQMPRWQPRCLLHRSCLPPTPLEDPLKAAQEKDRKLGAQLDDHYDYEDDFIDDSEFVEYYEGGDRRKAKYSGFFINKGTVEKVCGAVGEPSVQVRGDTACGLVDVSSAMVAARERRDARCICSWVRDAEVLASQQLWEVAL